MELTCRQNLLIPGVALIINALLFVVLPYLMMAQKVPVPIEGMTEGFRFVDSVSFPGVDSSPPRREHHAVIRPPEKQEIEIPEHIEIPLHEKQMALRDFPVERVHPDIDSRLVTDVRPLSPGKNPAEERSALHKAAYDETEVDQAPAAIVKTSPVYPYRARRMNLSGEVRVKFLVGVEGTISNIQIIDADPPGVFDKSVVTALSKWRFRPGCLQGRTVPTWVTTSIIFRLEDAV